MVRIVMVCSQNGGLRKLIMMQNLGAFLAAFAKHVLIADLDPQANTTSGMGLLPHRSEKIVYDALIGRCVTEDAVKKT